MKGTQNGSALNRRGINFQTKDRPRHCSTNKYQHNTHPLIGYHTNLILTLKSLVRYSPMATTLSASLKTRTDGGLECRINFCWGRPVKTGPSLPSPTPNVQNSERWSNCRSHVNRLEHGRVNDMIITCLDSTESRDVG
jgi:hypothetical protein